MATYGSIRRRCDRANRQRHVEAHNYHIDCRQFFYDAPGHFMITGGTDEQRRFALLNAVMAIRQREQCPVIIINNDALFQQQLIQLAQQDIIGRLLPLTNQTRAYDVFYHMPMTKIDETMQTISRMQGTMAISDLSNYANAFLSLVQHQGDVNLTTLRHYASYDDDQLSGYASSLGLTQVANNLTHNYSGSQDFRRILNNITSAFNNLTTAQCQTRASLANISGNDIYLVESNSILPDIFHICIAKELSVVMERFNRVVIIFNNIVINQNNHLYDVIHRGFSQSNRIMIGLCTDDAWSYAQNSGQAESLLSGFNTSMIINGRINDASLISLLNRFGTYDYHYPSVGGGVVPHIMPRLSSTNWVEAVDYNHPRIRLQDFQPYGVCVSASQLDNVAMYGGLE